MSKLNFNRNDKLKVGIADGVKYNSLELGSPIGILKEGEYYKAKLYSADTEFIGILASKEFTQSHLYIEPIKKGYVYTIRIAGDIAIGDKVAVSEDGTFIKKDDSNLFKVVKHIKDDIFEVINE